MSVVVLSAQALEISNTAMEEVACRSVDKSFFTAGPSTILGGPKIGFFCSSQCPGSVILKTFDVITTMRDQGTVIIGGFHSPMEWECLGILLRGRQPVIWAPARSIHGMHLKPELEPAFKAGRLLIVSPFEAKHKRITAMLAEERNRFVAALADRILMAHAAPGSRTLALFQDLTAQGKTVHTIDDPTNLNLFDLGAVAIKPEDESRTS